MVITNKTILVTGGAGFIGSHLTLELAKHNTVIVLDTTIDPRSYFCQHSLDKKTILILGDVRNQSLVNKIVSQYRVEYIFHLAAQTIVETAYENPAETIETNINGTLSMLEAVRNYKFVKMLIVASSDKAYGKLQKKKYVESDPLRGDHPYEASKSAADTLCTTYWKTYQTPVVITRFGNVYGEGDLNFTRLIPGIMRSVIHQTPLEIRSDGTYVRQYIYVKDVVNAYIKLVQTGKPILGEAFNFGSNDMLSVLDVIKYSRSILSKKISYTIMKTAKNEITYQALNYKKATNMLTWRPLSTFKKTLPSIFSYYQKLHETYII